eukprot:PLAT8805.1.p1 GENE.PLAT8805.1~~PLAT8805.1.p1  ORF type:complete len:1154 (+),score=547.43 PLAT8805.1:22-3483(+)
MEDAFPRIGPSIRLLPDHVVETFAEDGAGVSASLCQFHRQMSPEWDYFELEVLSAGAKNAIGLGIAPFDYPITDFPGWRNGSVAYHLDNGKLYRSRQSGQTFHEPIGAGHRVGCGVVFNAAGDVTDVYFTVDGEVVSVCVPFRSSVAMFASFACGSEGERVRFIADARPPAIVSREVVTPPGVAHLSLRLLSSLLRSVGCKASAAGAVSMLVDQLEELPAVSLMPDWAARDHGEKELPVPDGAVAYHSDFADGCQPLKALTAASGTALTMVLPTAEPLCGVQLTWSSVPKQMALLLSADGVHFDSVGDTTERFPAARTPHRLRFPARYVKAVRVAILQAGDKEAALVSATPLTPVAASDGRAVLADMQRWLVSAVAEPTLASHAMRSLLSLTLASGSAVALLRLLHVLLQLEGPLAEDCSEAADRMASRMFEAAMAERMRMACLPTKSTSAAVSGDLLFDPDCHHGVVTLQDGNTAAGTTSSTRSHAYTTLAISSGRHRWRVKIEKDRHGDEATCLGVGRKPVTSSSYDRCDHAWLLRCYNGYTYACTNRKETAPFKIHPGDEVEMLLDMAAGSLTYRVNDGDPFTPFTGDISGTVYPCVFFYSDNRLTRILSYTALDAPVASGGRGSAEPTPVELDSLKEISFYQQGELEPGKHGKSLSGIPVSVEGQSFTSSIAVSTPAAPLAAFVAYNLHGAYQQFKATVAIDNNSPSLIKPVHCRVLLDGSEVWHCALSSKTQKARVLLNCGSAHELRLHMTSDQETPVHVVWLKPTLLTKGAEDLLTEADSDMSSDGAEESKEELPADTHLALASRLLSTSASLSSALLRVMRLLEDSNKTDMLPDDVPFVTEMAADTLLLAGTLLRSCLPKLEAGTAGAVQLLCGVLRLLLVNLRSLQLKPEAASEAGLAGSTMSEETATGLAALQRTLTTLAEGAELPAAVRQLASAALSIGLPLFLPTLSARRELLLSQLASGAVMEAQVPWPALGDDGESDSRYERALLLLQSAADSAGWRCVVHGRWMHSLHVLVQLPSDDELIALLDRLLGTAFRRAGFPDFRLPLGCPQPGIPVVYEPALLERGARSLLDRGAQVRFYSTTVKFEEVEAALASYVATEAVATAEGEVEELDVPMPSAPPLSRAVSAESFDMGGLFGDSDDE